MTPQTFRHRLRSLGLTIRGFSAMTGVAYPTPSGWGTERGGRIQEFPGWVPVLLDCLECLHASGLREGWLRGFGRRSQRTGSTNGSDTPPIT